ncbi:MAG: hypothetical protein CUN52_02265 [Phototrophicales bacterium]|nr:MAG: hypothetical protein CUN52_02265 [Phototrophicales bacterium]
MNRPKWILSLLSFLLLMRVITIVNAQTEERKMGVINNDTPFAEIQFTVPQDGSLVTLDLKAMSGDLDTLLYLVDRDGNILAENDDRVSGRDTNSFIEFPQADAGRYLIIVTRYGVVNGTSSGEYELIIRVAPQTETSSLVYDVSDDALAKAGYPQLDVRPRADWTIIAYYGGDNNLAPSLEVDFKEFEVGGGSGNGLNVVLFFDRSPEYITSESNWVGARIFEVTGDRTGEGITQPPILDSQPLADLGNVNSGDGQTFAQFLVWALKYYPANRYIITFGSHGAAWEGVSRDDSVNQDLITLPEMREAFRLGIQQAGIEKFDIIINDACLMASIEYFNVVADYFQYALASPEIVVDPAHDMSILLRAIRTQPNAPVTDYIDPLVDHYMDVDILRRPGSDVAFLTSTFLDLSQYGAVDAAVNKFASVIKTNPALYSSLLGRARANAYVYSGFLGDDALIDLGALMRQIVFLANPATNADLIEAAQSVLTALQASVLYGRGGGQVASQTNTYQSIYFPSSSQKFNPNYLVETYLSGWGAMLRAYYNAVTPQVWSLGESIYRFHPPVAPKVTITNIYPTNELSNVNPLSITQQIVGRNIAFTNFTVDQLQDDGTSIRLLSQRVLRPVVQNGVFQQINTWESGVDITEIVYDVTLPQVTDNTNGFYELLNITENVSSLEGRYREPGSDIWNNVSLVFNIPPEGQPAQVQRVVNRSTASNAVAVVTIPVGSEFQSFRYLVTPDGRVVTQIGNTYTWPEGGLQWSWQPAPNGNYNLGLIVTTFGGTTGFNNTAVTINNDGVNPDLRSNIRAGEGFSWSRPKTWLPAVGTAGPLGFGLLRSSNPDSSSNFSFYPVRPSQGLTPDLTNIASIAERDYALTRMGDYRPITVDGQPVLEFDYQYTQDGASFTGRGFAYYIAKRGVPLGFVFAAEVREGSLDDLDEIYAILRDNLVIFDPLNTSARDWYFDYPLDVSTLAVPQDWAFVGSNDIWARYAPVDAPDGATFLAVGEFFISGTDANAILDELLASYIHTDDVTEFAEIDRRDYAGRYHVWNAVIYDRVRDGQAVIGRLYITFFNKRVYALWMETPKGDFTESVYTNTLEPMVDRMQIDVLDEAVAESDNTQPVSITAADNLEPGLLLRYDGRSLLLYNRLPSASIDISDVRFIQTPLTGSQITFAATDWEFGDKRNVGPTACYHVWNAGYRDLPLGEYPVEICRTRQAFRSTRNPFWLSETGAGTFQVYNGSTLVGTCETVPAIAPENYVVGSADNIQKTCVIDLTP